MPEMTQYTPGSFCWMELLAADTEKAKAFYGELFGWTTNDVPGPDNSIYTILLKNDKSVGALCAMPDVAKQHGVPTHWQNYIAVVNVDESAERVSQLGGNVLMPPMDADDIGRMAIVQDPTGAAFSLWQSEKHPGAELYNEPGAWCWNELYTKNLNAAKEFYANLFGWTAEETPGAGGQPYTVFKNGETPIAGMLEIQPEWGEVPPCWGVYFSVENLDKTFEQAKVLGGNASCPVVMEVENVGRFAMLHDPQGAHFSIIELAEM